MPFLLPYCYHYNISNSCSWPKACQIDITSLECVRCVVADRTLWSRRDFFFLGTPLCAYWAGWTWVWGENGLQKRWGRKNERFHSLSFFVVLRFVYLRLTYRLHYYVHNTSHGTSVIIIGINLQPSDVSYWQSAISPRCRPGLSFAQGIWWFVEPPFWRVYGKGVLPAVPPLSGSSNLFWKSSKVPQTVVLDPSSFTTIAIGDQDTTWYNEPNSLNSVCIARKVARFWLRITFPLEKFFSCHCMVFSCTEWETSETRIHLCMAYDQGKKFATTKIHEDFQCNLSIHTSGYIVRQKKTDWMKRLLAFFGLQTVKHFRSVQRTCHILSS